MLVRKLQSSGIVDLLDIRLMYEITLSYFVKQLHVAVAPDDVDAATDGDDDEMDAVIVDIIITLSFYYCCMLNYAH